MPVIYLPTLHPRLAPAGMDAVLLLDPGLPPGLETPPAATASGERGQRSAFRPESLPLSPPEARAALAEMLQFGGQASNLKDLAYFSAAGVPDLYAGTSQALAEQIAGMDAEKTGPSREELVQAQMTLVLALTVESRELEMSDLAARVETGWSNLSRNLDGHPPGLGLDMTPLSGNIPAWRPVVEAALTLLSPSLPLATARADVIEELEEQGVAFRQASSEEAAQAGLEAGETLLTAEAEGWKLCGRKRPKPGAPWLDAPRRLFAWRA